jgi:hypothetical protein
MQKPNLNQSENFDFGNQSLGGGTEFNLDGPATISNGSRRLQMSPNKTGGKIKMQNLRAEDIDHNKFLGRDATNAIEGEFRQFERRFDIV